MANKKRRSTEDQADPTVEYIASLAETLADLATQSKLPFLAYLLQMVVEESGRSARR